MAALAAIVIAPSIASNDAPTSRLIVVYGEDGAIAEVLYTKFNPDAVLVDHRDHRRGAGTLLLAGIGDAISEEIRGRARCRFRRAHFYKGAVQVVLTIAASCYEEIAATPSTPSPPCAGRRRRSHWSGPSSQYPPQRPQLRERRASRGTRAHPRLFGR